MRFVFVLLLCLAAAVQSRKFRFAIAMSGSNWDFGWNFHVNTARVNLQKHLQVKYPDVETEHTFTVVPQSYTADCDPQFAAWVGEGYDLIFGQIGHMYCLARLASEYPNVTFIGNAGAATGPVNYANLWTRFYENAYLAGYMAGLMTKVKKVCISAGIRIPAPVMDVTAFCRGVHAANPAVEVHILETGQLQAPLLEVWNVNQSYAMGCDVVFVSSLDIDGCEQADRLGLMSVGFFSDARFTVGESVITSAFVDFTPMFVRVAEAVLNGTFANETRKPDWWMGWEWGAMILADPSFLVPANVTARVQAQVANLSRVYCGRVCTQAECLCTDASCCVSDAQLNRLAAYPDFAIEHGVLQLPGQACEPGQRGTWHIGNFTMACADCPAGTYAYNADQLSECRPCPAATYSLAGATNCTACPAGTYNDQPQRGQCSPCTPDSIAANAGAQRCNVCPSGLANGDRTECTAASLTWLAGLAAIAVLFGAVGLWAWWASRKMRKLRKQFSNDNVAVECAAAIARLDLQAVAWLNDIPKPNCIQLSFIRIVKILDEVRKYVPDQLLQALAAGQDAGESDAEDLRSAATSIDSPTPNGGCRSRVVPVKSPSHMAQRQSSSVSSLDGPRLFAVRKVTYLLVRFDVRQHDATPGQAEGNLRAFLSHLVDAVKAGGGTVGNVLYDAAVIHWGSGRRAVAESPLRAVETAVAIAAFAGHLQGGAGLQLNIAIGCGNAIAGVVETATNHFFVVGGGQVPLVQRIAAKDWRAVLGAPILITDAVRACVQYSFLCHPRLVDGDDLIWEPIAHKKERGVDEWMYQLQKGEEQAAEQLDILLSPFTAMRAGDFAAAEALLSDVPRRCPALRPADLAALKLLACNAAARTNLSL